MPAAWFRTNTWWGSVLLGIGLGGFVDGILFHQILQWHHMATSIDGPRADDLGFNTFLDGLFHATTWLFTVAGVAMLLADRRAAAVAPRRLIVAGVLVGAGIFNVVEGLVAHQLLGLHHVHPSEALAWDLTFLAVGVASLVIGVAMARAASKGGALRTTQGS